MGRNRSGSWETLRLKKSAFAALLASLLFFQPNTLAWPQTPAPAEQELVERAASGAASDLYALSQFYRTRGGDGDLARAAVQLEKTLGAADREFESTGNPYGPQILQSLANIYSELGRKTEVLAASTARVERLRQIAPQSVDLANGLIDLGVAQDNAGDGAAAAKTNLEARSILTNGAPEGAPNLVALGLTYLNESVYQKAANDLAASETASLESRNIHARLATDANPEIAQVAKFRLRQALNDLVKLSSGRSDFAKAAGYQRDIVTLVRATPDAGDATAVELIALSNLLRSGNQHAQSLEALDEALAIRIAAKAEPKPIADVDWERGVTLHNLGRNDEAITAYQSAIERLKPLGDVAAGDVASLLGNIAINYSEMKHPEDQRQALVEQISLLRKHSANSLPLADALNTLSQVELALGHNRKAAAAAVEEVAIRRASQPATVALAQGLDNQGRAELALKNTNAAADLFREATDIAVKIGTDGKQSAISTRIMLGIALYQAREYDRALAELEGALAWLDGLENLDETGRLNAAAALGNLADYANRLGLYAQSEKAGLRQIAILRELKPDTVQLAWPLYTLGFNYYRLARYDDGLKPMREAQAIFLKLGGESNTDYLETLRQEGWLLEGAGRLEEALAVHARAVRLVAAANGVESVEYARTLSGHGWTLRQMQRFEESERELARALAIYDKRLGQNNTETATGNINLGILKRLLGKNEDAIKLSMKALAVVTRDPRTTLDEQRWTYETLSLAFKGLGDRKRAILFAKQAINVQQRVRSFNKEYSTEQMQKLREEWRRLYENLAELLISEGRLSEAQAVLAMEKEEELVDFIQRDGAADLRDSKSEYTAQEEKAQHDVEALLAKPMAAAIAFASLDERKQLGDLSKEEQQRYDRLQAKLDDAYDDFMGDVDKFLETAETEDTSVQLEVEAINLSYTASVQDELRAFEGRAAMLQIASLGDTTHIFLTVPEASIHRVVDVPREKLTRMVFEALDAVENRSPEAKQKLAALYEVLVRPVAQEIRDTKATTLMLNLQGFLRYVPFAALHDGNHYLIEDYALALYTPAARTRFEAGDRDAARSAGFGTTEAHPGFAPLPGVAREMQAIFGDGQTKGALTGVASLDAAFTRDQFRDALKHRPEFVHIASHFKLVPGRETDSYLLLGDGSPLSLEDIRKGRGFRFGGVDLLTLSACETARGGGSEGDEVESFGALAQMNGASAVMATLWPVADEATANIMQSFYRNMIEGKLDKAEALRRAQIDAISGKFGGPERSAVSLKQGPTAAALDSSHPYFWSPFVLMGNWL